MSIKITPELLANLRQKAENSQPAVWELNDNCDVVSDAHTVAECGFEEDADYIAAADPATVLALVEEIERLQEDAKHSWKTRYPGWKPPKESEAGQ